MPTAPFTTPLAESVYSDRYIHPDDKNWAGTSKRVAGVVTGELYKTPGAQKHKGHIEALQGRVYDLMLRRQFIPGGRYLYAAGRDLHQVNNCVLMRCGDSRERWAELSYNAEMALSTGAGIGVWYGDVRPNGSPISRTGGVASGPVAKMCQVNDTGRHIMQGGFRRSAIWAGLPWSHPDVFDFIQIKDWPQEIRDLKAKWMKEKQQNFPATMDFTNISVTLDDEFFAAYKNPGHARHDLAVRVFRETVARMVTQGEPGFSVDIGKNAGEVLRNACTEVTSADSDDVCNLGHLVMPRLLDLKEFGQAVTDAAMFLTAGSLYSDVPYDQVAVVRDLNRRLGLGQMGGHEMLMRAGLKYGSDEAFEFLEPYMLVYERALENVNTMQADLGISPSVGATAIAPTGTTGIVAETTPSWDPMFAAAELRDVIAANTSGDTRQKHVVVDPTAARLLKEGVKAEHIEDAYSLALQPERRLAQQAFVQDYVDHGVSSTVNLPEQMFNERDQIDFGDTLMEYLPRLRGITCYPDGAIPGQPRTAVDLEWALAQDGVEFDVDEATCRGAVCSS